MFLPVVAMTLLLAAPPGSEVEGPPVDESPAASEESPADPPPIEAPPEEPPATVTLVDRAHEHWERGELDEALALADEAILSDPEFGQLYLLRGQLQVDMADKATGLERSRLLTAAAADLDRYLSRSESKTAEASLLEERDALLAAAEQIRRQELGKETAPPEEEPTPPPAVLVNPPSESMEPRPRKPVDERRDPVVPITLSGAGMLAVTGAALGATALRVEQRCGPPCSADVVPRPGPLSVAVAGSAGAAALAGWGVARWGRDAPRKRMRVVAITTGALAGAAAVVTAVTAGLAQQRWGTVSPSASGDLADLQRLANASVASGVFVAPLLTSAIVAAIPRRRQRNVARR